MYLYLLINAVIYSLVLIRVFCEKPLKCQWLFARVLYSIFVAKSLEQVTIQQSKLRGCGCASAGKLGSREGRTVTRHTKTSRITKWSS